MIFKNRRDIKIGDTVKAVGPDIDNNYFHGEKKKVVHVRHGPNYAGGQFVYVEGMETGFYAGVLRIIEPYS